MAKRKPRKARTKIGYDGNPSKLVEVRGITREEREARVTMKRNVNENPMDRLHHQHLITPMQRDAGLRLIRDWELSQIGPIRSPEIGNLSFGGGGPVGLADAKCDAITRLRDVMRLVGETGRVVLIGVVLDGEKFEHVAARMRCHAKGVLPALRVALDALVVFYNVHPSSLAA